MFGKLKDLAVGSGALEKAMVGLEPIVREQLAKVQTLGAEMVSNDLHYAKYVVEPAYLAVVSASNGATKLVPQFKDRFARMMVALRDELVVIEGAAVRLVEDYATRLPKVLADSIKN